MIINNDMEKEERSEYVSIYVTPKVKREFELAKDNKALQETIIRNFCQSETYWLEGEMKEIDEATIKYTAKLLTIKDRFQEAHASYVGQLEDICTIARSTFLKIDGISKSLETQLASAYSDTKQLSEKINSLNYSHLEKFLDVVERFNRMPDTEKELIKMLLAK